jgi:GNAT superfamily N-acetyltransferase
VRDHSSDNLLSNYEIRAPQRDEIASLPAIEVAAATIFPAEDIPAEMRQSGLDLCTFQTAADEGRLFVAICLPLARPVGLALATLVDGSAHLHEMDVLPEHARRGLGRGLLGAVVAWAEQRGFPSVTLTSFRQLPWNAPFYAGQGFCTLSDQQLPAGLARLLDAEEAAGLDRSKRVAMRLDLASSPSAPYRYHRSNSREDVSCTDCGTSKSC